MADKLHSEDAEQARELWAAKGKQAFAVGGGLMAHMKMAFTDYDKLAVNGDTLRRKR